MSVALASKPVCELQNKTGRYRAFLSLPLKVCLNWENIEMWAADTAVSIFNAALSLPHVIVPSDNERRPSQLGRQWVPLLVALPKQIGLFQTLIKEETWKLIYL